MCHALILNGYLKPENQIMQRDRSVTLPWIWRRHGRPRARLLLTLKQRSLRWCRPGAPAGRGEKINQTKSHNIKSAQSSNICYLPEKGNPMRMCRQCEHMGTQAVLMQPSELSPSWPPGCGGECREALLCQGLVGPG